MKKHSLLFAIIFFGSLMLTTTALSSENCQGTLTIAGETTQLSHAYALAEPYVLDPNVSSN